jgi:hypothetical protein
MTLDLSDPETDALAKLLRRTVDDDRYPLSPRIQTLDPRKDPAGAAARALAAAEALRAAARYGQKAALNSERAARPTWWLSENRIFTFFGHPAINATRQIGSPLRRTFSFPICGHHADNFLAYFGSHHVSV